jgi:thioredoxin reductase (NADPH)
VITIDELADIPLFADLTTNELEYLASSVEDIRLTPGEYLSHEGEERALFVIVEGMTELTKVVGGVERFVASRLPGELVGEVPMMLSTPLPASCRAVVSSRAVKLSVKAFYTLAAMAPQISATVGALALERVGGLREIAAERVVPEILVVGSNLDPRVHEVQTFLHRNQISFDSFAPEDPELAAQLGDVDEIEGPYPVVQLRDGTRLVSPTMRDVAIAGGLQVMPGHANYDVVIVGGGPAGLTAAVNAASEGLRTVLVERVAPGGQAGTSTRIENYTGFPFGISGDDLASRALKQARRLGAEIVVTRSIEHIDPESRTLTMDGGVTLAAKSIVLATGVDWRRIEIDSVERFLGRGLYYGAARSDAGLTQGKEMYVIGAGNSAGQAALFFSRYAKTVTLVVRGESLATSMSSYLIDQIATKSNIGVETRSEVVALYGDEALEAFDLLDRSTGRKSRRDAEVLFVMIGANAATDWLPTSMTRNPQGFIVTGSDAIETGRLPRETGPYALETSIPGIFAIGDVRSGSVKRVASGVGEGAMAIAFVHQYLQA